MHVSLGGCRVPDLSRRRQAAGRAGVPGRGGEAELEAWPWEGQTMQAMFGGGEAPVPPGWLRGEGEACSQDWKV